MKPLIFYGTNVWTVLFLVEVNTTDQRDFSIWQLGTSSSEATWKRRSTPTANIDSRLQEWNSRGYGWIRQPLCNLIMENFTNSIWFCRRGRDGHLADVIFHLLLTYFPLYNIMKIWSFITKNKLFSLEIWITPLIGRPFSLFLFKVWECTYKSSQKEREKKYKEKFRTIRKLCDQHIELRNILNQNKKLSENITDSHLIERFVESLPPRKTMKLTVQRWILKELSPFIIKPVLEQV